MTYVLTCMHVHRENTDSDQHNVTYATVITFILLDRIRPSFLLHTSGRSKELANVLQMGLIASQFRLNSGLYTSTGA